MFGELFVQIDILIIKKLVVYLLDINQEFLFENKKMKKNINGLSLALHTDQVDMIYYFNFRT